MCKRNIPYIDHVDVISPEHHLNEDNLHLNGFGNIEFAENFTRYLYELDWWPSDNSSTSEFEIKKSLRIEKSVDQSLHDLDNISASENVFESEVSILSSTDETDTNSVLNSSNEFFLDPIDKLREVRQKNSNRLIIAQLNINYIRYKFDS